MTPKAEDLVFSLAKASARNDSVSFHEYKSYWNALESYITELERKAAICDKWTSQIRKIKEGHGRIVYAKPEPKDN